MNTTWSRPTKYIAGVGLVLLAVYLIYLSRSVLSILIIAALIAMIVHPAINWLQVRARLPRGLAVALVYLVGVILVPLALALAIPAIINAVNYVISLDYQAITRSIMEWTRGTLSAIKNAQLPIASLDMYLDRIADALLEQIQPVAPTTPQGEAPPVSTILQSLSTALTTTFGAAAGLVGSVVSSVALVFFMLLASIYMSLGAHTYREMFLRSVPEVYQPEIITLMGRIGRQWNAFFQGELLLMLIIGVMSWVGLTILGVPGAIYLAIVAGLLELIPNLGPIIATVPAVIVALLQGSTHLPVDNLVLAALVVGLYVLIQQLENNLIVPRVLGGAVDLPPLIVLIGVLVGATVSGVLGALLATPMIASLREITRYVYRKILGQDPYPPEEQKAAEQKNGQFTALAVMMRGWVERINKSRRTARKEISGPIPNSGAESKESAQEEPPAPGE